MATLRARLQRLAAEDASLRPALEHILRTSSDKGDLVWAADNIDRALELIRDAVDVLDARDGGSSLADEYGEVSKLVDNLRRRVSSELNQASKTLRKVAR